MYIRKYAEKDFCNITNVCLATANAENASEKQKKLLLKLYCNYYIEHEPENCFSLIDDNENAVGYILCSENFNRYIRTFRSFYLCDIKKLGSNQYITALCDICSHGLFSKKFPTHMHIDILPEYQHCGQGTALLNALKNELSSKNIHSLLLCVDAKNKKGVNFYLKNGFVIYRNLRFCYIMTLNF